MAAADRRDDLARRRRARVGLWHLARRQHPGLALAGAEERIRSSSLLPLPGRGARPFRFEAAHRSEERRVGKECRSTWASAQAEDGIRDHCVTGVQTCALPISWPLPIAAMISLAGVALAWAYGISRGGSTQDSLWQVQKIAYVPLLFFLFQAAVRGPSDSKRLIDRKSVV